MKTYKGMLNGQGLKFGIVVSRFNEVVTAKLLSGALDALERHGVDGKDVEVFWVPGAFELPPMTKRVSARNNNAVIVLGTVVRGSTPHFEYIASEVAKGVGQIALDSEKPVIFGVLTTDDMEQAIERAGGKSNKGSEAAVSAIEMANLYKAAK